MLGKTTYRDELVRQDGTRPEQRLTQRTDLKAGGVGNTGEEQAWKAYATQPLERPYGTSYFLSGKIEGRPLRLLLDTGCTTNLLGKHVYDRLPERIKQQLVECDTHGAMADGTQLTFYGVIQLSIRLKELVVEEKLVVSRISEDVILGMPFLAAHQCTIDFGRPTVVVDGRPIECTDRHGRKLTCTVQIVRETTIPPKAEMTLQCRVAARECSPVGLIEGKTDNLLLATSLNCPDPDGRVVVRCINPASQPLKVKAGTTIGVYTAVEGTDISTDSKQTRETAMRQEVDVPEHLRELYDQAKRNCDTIEQEEKLCGLLAQYQDVFSKGDGDMGHTSLVEHSIPVTEGTRPIRQPPHRLGPEKEAEAERQVQELLKKGLIEPASGAWSSPVVLVRKKDGTWRFCVDYRRLNSVTRQDAYPLPRIDESLDALAGSRYFSTLDLVSGYWQVPLDQDAQDKSAFITRTGLWKWKVLPFGLTSAPATFQRLMEQVVQGLHWKTLLLYLDDIIVIAPNFDTHMERLGEVLGRLGQAGLKLKPTKCELLQTEVCYLGHVVSQHGVATDPRKLEAVENWPEPKELKELQAFLGTVGYYRQYIKGFATIAKPLTRLTGARETWQWTKDQRESFETLKRCLLTAPVLGYPDHRLSYILDTDASKEGIGAVLSQIQDGEERVIGYYSKTLSPAERNYCVTRRELLAVVKGMKHFRPYLYGQVFLLRTDHASLLWLCRRKEPSDQVARWLEALAEFKYTVRHRAGARHGNADGLSRRPCRDCKQCQRIEGRDGGPTWAEIEEELAGSSDAGSGRNSEAQAEAMPIQEMVLDPLQLAKEQKEGPGAVATMYEVVRTGNSLSKTELELGNTELKKLHQRHASMRLNAQGVLEIQVVIHGRPRWTAICPERNRKAVIWQTHQMTHSGVGRTIGRLQLTWYWVGMTADIRRTIRTCEVCQKAKSGGTRSAGGQQRLYAGRPWQKVAVDLVGPLPETQARNRWILVLTDHFTRWQDALPLPDATAPVVAATLDERVFCYFGLPEQIHSDQGAQFESQLMEELCGLWKVDKTHTTPYHPQSNGIVERNNRVLGDSLRALLLRRGQEEWDLLLAQVMRAFRGTPHSATGETANFMMLGRELRLPDQLQIHPPPVEIEPQHLYVQQMVERLQTVHDMLREQQREVRQEDQEEPPLFSPGDMVWLENRRRKKGENPKLQAKFLGPYTVTRAWPNHTYEVKCRGQVSIQNECRLKAYRPCPDEIGRAPVILEPNRRPNMRGATRQRERSPSPESWYPPPVPPAVLEDLRVRNRQQADPALTRPPEQAGEDHRAAEAGDQGSETTEEAARGPPDPVAAEEATASQEEAREEGGRPRREVRMPARFRDYECYALHHPSDGEEPVIGHQEGDKSDDDQETPLKWTEKQEKEGLLSGAQAHCMAPEYQKRSPSWPCAQLYDRFQRGQTCCQRAQTFIPEIACNYLRAAMDNTAEKGGWQEALDGLLAEEGPTDGALHTPEDKAGGVDTPWWLREETLLGEVELDWGQSEVPSPQAATAVQPCDLVAVPARADSTAPVKDDPAPVKADPAPVKADPAPVKADPALVKKDIAQLPKGEPSRYTQKMKAKGEEMVTAGSRLEEHKKLSVETPARPGWRPARTIRGKPLNTLGVQDLATGDSTPPFQVEGRPTGAGTGYQGCHSARPNVSPPSVVGEFIEECAVRLVRLADPEEEEMDGTGPLTQLSWITPETARAITDLIRGPTPDKCYCRDCYFRGTRKRVRIHCAQHFLRYYCECQFNRPSRDSVVDHQRAKNNSEQHGGQERRVYKVDEASYPTFCLAIGWQDPPAFAPAVPTKKGSPPPEEKELETAPETEHSRRQGPPAKRDVRTRLGRPHARPRPETTERPDKPDPSQPDTPEKEPPVRYRIPWTARALLRRSREDRHHMAAEIRAQMAGLQEAVVQGRARGDVEKECQLHAEIELLRQVYVRLSHA